MPQKTYSLYNSEIIEGDQQLAVEIGKNYIALVIGTTSRLSGFEYYDAEENDLEELLSYVKSHSQLLDKSYSETKLYYNLEEAVLVPVGQFSAAVAAEFVDLVHGSKPASRINVENINVQPGIVNVYRSNEYWQELINTYFRAVTKRHLYSKLIEHTQEESVKVQFYNNEIVVVATGNNQLQMARTFDFSSDEDVVYCLLNTCKQTAIDPVNTVLEVSGFIDEPSSLTQLLKKYFGTVRFDNAAPNILRAEELSKYPLHYFTPFFNLLQ